MTVSDGGGRPPQFGYLDVSISDQGDYTGGLLVVTAEGRPIEFHCTEPVRPNRVQSVLYGATLRQFVTGELVGAALVRRAASAIDLLLVSDADAAIAGERLGKPTAVVTPEAATPPAEIADRLSEAFASLAASIDLTEPFERVREAIREAHRLAGEEESDAGVAA